MNSGKVFLGILAGVAGGALLGILFAPEKGSTTRKKISKKSKDYAEGLTEKFDELLDTINEKFKSVKKEAEKVMDKAEAVKKETKSTTV